MAPRQNIVAQLRIGDLGKAEDFQFGGFGGGAGHAKSEGNALTAL